MSKTNLAYFIKNQCISSVFPLIIFSTLFISNRIELPIPRYDFILLVCIITQIIFVLTRFETKEELKVISVFHVIGLAMEIFKVHMGSWSYPEEAYSKVFGVPLYSGFMYASVASYLCQCWKRYSVALTHYPRNTLVCFIGLFIYVNFYIHHFIYDFRWVITALLVLIFFRSSLSFRVQNHQLKLPLVLIFFLAGLLIWIAENIATFLGAWHYPNQENGWELVHLGKISSWFLLIIVSFIIVATIQHKRTEKAPTPR